jgi:hypothetical protein
MRRSVVFLLLLVSAAPRQEPPQPHVRTPLGQLIEYRRDAATKSAGAELKLYVCHDCNGLAEADAVMSVGRAKLQKAILRRWGVQAAEQWNLGRESAADRATAVTTVQGAQATIRFDRLGVEPVQMVLVDGVWKFDFDPTARLYDCEDVMDWWTLWIGLGSRWEQSAIDVTAGKYASPADLKNALDNMPPLIAS